MKTRNLRIYVMDQSHNISGIISIYALDTEVSNAIKDTIPHFDDDFKG